ncbi:MAG: 2OG-Fe(II) oxygenase [Gammaproteobacteria bacterium]|nr:2OG-Fe(II) oxygenase [Gammaproteobacteria bacterium]
MPAEDIVRQSHYLGGRYENLYLAPESFPEISAILDVVIAQASCLLACPETELRIGWWLNLMRPGDATFAHTHDDGDELLSGVYYIEVPPDSGKLVLMNGQQCEEIQPREGMFVFFKPEVLHEVTRNESNRTRLSIGFNIGPVPVL